MGEAAGIRAAAARAVAAVAGNGQRLESALAEVVPGRAQRPAIQSLAFGTLRWYFELDACLGLLLDRPAAALDPEIRALALVGLFQLSHGATPAHAAVAETVEATRVLGRPRAAGLVNALLRRFQREGAAIMGRAHENPQARHAHPSWLLDALMHEWPDHWQVIVAAGNAEPPMWLRVNRRHGTRDAYLARLAAAGMSAECSAFAPEALRLAQPVNVGELPGFAEGAVSVQDAAAQLAPYFLAAQSGMRVLDACAAPGGKACHMLELEPGIAELVALDIDPLRSKRIEENLSRLRLTAKVVVGDAANADWWDGRAFDRILLDAPCSGTGVIRRHPDIKLLRRPDDIARFRAAQLALLRSVYALLTPGGRLLYASCSVLRAENSAMVGEFLSADSTALDVTESARLLLPGVAPVQCPGPGCALPSGAADADGFYYACLEKRA
ncbi:MAG: 16S rRNA (cytosine(967)-C(5))-methyltransferase RsmB [Gammaproteobacteria bacterium]|nr:16S rRNA (cytosine(967)-C(5))-methyltransferase RsmB [Gammaproteobacteria bacterium]